MRITYDQYLHCVSLSDKIEVGVPSGNAPGVDHVYLIVTSYFKDFLYKSKYIFASVIACDLHDGTVLLYRLSSAFYSVRFRAFDIELDEAYVIKR